MAQAAKDLISGTTAGVTSVLASHPIDIVRVRLQCAAAGSSTSPVAIGRSMLLHEGVSSFYKGVVPPAAGVGLLMSIMFSAQQAARRRVASHDDARSVGALENALCGAVGGLAQAPAANAIELLKVRQQVQTGAPSSLRKVAVDVWRSGGAMALSRGLPALALRDALGYACYFGFCETALARLAPPGGSKADVSPSRVLVVGMLGGILYWLPIMPLDTIKSRVHADSLSAPRYRGTLDCALSAMRARHGVWGLYRGLALSCVMALPKNAAKLLAFTFVPVLLDCLC